MNCETRFPMPKSIVVDEATMTDTYAKFLGVETAVSGSVYPEGRGNGCFIILRYSFC